MAASSSDAGAEYPGRDSTANLIGDIRRAAKAGGDKLKVVFPDRADEVVPVGGTTVPTAEQREPRPET